MTKFLLVLGVSGVGKSTIIQYLLMLDKRFTYISPDITRILRKGEKDKRSISNNEMNILAEAGTYVVINQLFNNIRYATPRRPIIKSLINGDFPILDWPITKLKIMQKEFPLYTVYLAPPNLNVLKLRLLHDNRDKNGSRFKNAQAELYKYWNGSFDQDINLHCITYTNETSLIAHKIYKHFLKNIK